MKSYSPFPMVATGRREEKQEIKELLAEKGNRADDGFGIRERWAV